MGVYFHFDIDYSFSEQSYKTEHTPLLPLLYLNILKSYLLMQTNF